MSTLPSRKKTYGSLDGDDPTLFTGIKLTRADGTAVHQGPGYTDEPIVGIATGENYKKPKKVKTENVFCPTGPGGGVDPSCPGTKTTTKGETLHFAVRKNKKWLDRDGKPHPEHVQHLGIPPAWKNVFVNHNPDGTVMATGTDAKGRTQVKYSGNHTAQAAANKFGRVSELRAKRVAIFRQIQKDRTQGKGPLREKAECLRLIMETGIRPGSDSDTKATHQSFGATTLLGKHVITKDDGSVALKFAPGKHQGKEVEFAIHSPAMAKILLRRVAKAGPDGRLFDTTAGAVRGYSKKLDGGGFKTKDHRTALGTEIAIKEIKAMGIKPKTKSEYKKAVNAVGDKVSQTLGNGRGMALKSYIDPSVWSRWKKSAKVT